MTIADRIAELRALTPFQSLSEPTLTALAAALEPTEQPEGDVLIREDETPHWLWILRQGKLERSRHSSTNQTSGECLLPGSVLHWREILLELPGRQTVTCLEPCRFWRLAAPTLQDLGREYPELLQQPAQEMAVELQAMASQLQFEQERQQELRPYLVTRLRRGIVGPSRYAQRLRQDIRQAARDPRQQPVLIFGEPGLNKDNIAALIHFGSDRRHEPLIRVNCNLLTSQGAELFGRTGRPGLLDWLGNGTLILNNLQDLPEVLRPRLRQLLLDGLYRPVDSAPDTRPRHTGARFLLISEASLPELKGSPIQQIKVPPLRVRKPDIAAMVEYFLSLYCRRRGRPRPTLTPEAARRLQAYDYPGNITELEGLVERALSQLGNQTDLTEDVFWPADLRGNRFRRDLLMAWPGLRQFLRSDWWPDRLNVGFTAAAFVGVVALLYFGPQVRQQNVALNVFWAWWWPLVLIGFPFVGRLWCAVCPFMIWGELLQKLSLWLWPRQLLPWPREEAERWGGWFLYGLFVLILLWEELWNLENTAWLSGSLLLLITAGAVIFSQLFERRFWCRYLCPIGGMNGLFAKLSITELRARRGVCSASCSTYQCYKGGPACGEGQDTLGCPVYSHPAQLTDNRNCVLCMTCLKACPHRSIEVNLRPPGIELWTTHQPQAAEVALLFLLLGAVPLHHLPALAALVGLPTVWLEGFAGHSLLAAIALLLPGLLIWGLQPLQKLLNPSSRPFLELAYGWLPLVLGANLAHYLHLGLTEAGQVLPVGFASFGLADPGLPIWVAHPAVVAFLQGTTLVFGWLLSALLLRKIARQPFRTLVLPLATMLGVTTALWMLLV